MVAGGIQLIKIWLEVSDKEQKRRFEVEGEFMRAGHGHSIPVEGYRPVTPTGPLYHATPRAALGAIQRVYFNIGSCAEQCWVNHLTDLRQLDPQARNFGQTPFNIGQCRRQLGEFHEAIVAYREVLTQLAPEEIAFLVDGVTKLDQVQFKSRKEAQAESFRKMILAMVRDIRVIMVKLADRTHNMRTLSAMPPEKRRAVARETLDIYGPIANRLGIHSLKLELEELGFRTLYPQRYRVIERELKRARGNQREFLPKIVKSIRQAMTQAGVSGRVEGREKHLYSVYLKMRRKRLSLSQVVDMFGVRIVVGSVDECYRTLGLVHGLYRPTPGRFKDYIAIPRVNGYQSLHTSLFGPNGAPIEVQIRTEDMHRMAESGIAAHWQYKTGEKDGEAQQERAREWLKGVMDLHEGSAEELVESVKVDLFPDKVYVFTPKGDILRLPRGSTCVDFAYAVHTDVGNRCVAAKIDRRLVPLRTQINNGQTVTVRQTSSPTPATMTTAWPPSAGRSSRKASSADTPTIARLLRRSARSARAANAWKTASRSRCRRSWS